MEKVVLFDALTYGSIVMPQTMYLNETRDEKRNGVLLAVR